MVISTLNTNQIGSFCRAVPAPAVLGHLTPPPGQLVRQMKREEMGLKDRKVKERQN